ncbi:MAG: hypothetical protein PHQ66_02255 [Candidatus Nanoarchaeia archaeon]|nr:hypothetical protein [Candidatus Nanoarchaeia archaeon]MDD5357808.1 hypothetical protein [Candidatus Nanoarchaeia archaeon]MDD5588727.1 hypothetical protein [Candidatus Nanoarchaeia archaeon]
MELEFNPEQEFERIIGRPVSDYERKELKRFLEDYLIRNETDKENLALTIESALEADSKDTFSKKDLENSLYEYKNTHRIISKKLISEVKEACNKYHRGDDSKIQKVLRKQDFLEDAQISNLYSKKTEEKYTFLFLNKYNTIPVEDVSKFVSIPPKKAEEFEALLNKQKNIGVIHGTIPTWLGLLSAIGISVYGCNNNLVANGGIGFGIFAASWVGIGITSYMIEKMINQNRKKQVTKEIEKYFSDESPYPHLCSSNFCDSEIILNALAE